MRCRPLPSEDRGTRPHEHCPIIDEANATYLLSLVRKAIEAYKNGDLGGNLTRSVAGLNRNHKSRRAQAAARQPSTSASGRMRRPLGRRLVRHSSSLPAPTGRSNAQSHTTAAERLSSTPYIGSYRDWLFRFSRMKLRWDFSNSVAPSPSGIRSSRTVPSSKPNSLRIRRHVESLNSA